MSSPPDRATLLRLTLIKAIASMGVRWVPAFLPTLERAFGATTGQLTAVIGIGEISGVTTVAVGPHLDRGRERLVLTSSLAAISVSSFVALAGSLTMFAIAFVAALVGSSNLSVAGQAWISQRVDYEHRGRSIGTFEVGWALALLVGGPIAAVLINLFGWRGPFVFVGVTAALGALLVALTIPTEPIDLALGQDTPALKTRVHRRARFVIGGHAFLSTAGLSAFVVTGTWLEESFGVSTGGIGTITLGLGMVELAASSGSAAFADRLGKHRSTLVAEVVLMTGLIVMVLADDRLAIGVIGLLLLLLGFEYAIVTSSSLVSEAMPEAKGRILGVNQAVGTVVRGLGVVVSGLLFDRYGIKGTVVLAGSCAVVSLLCYRLSRSGR